VDLDLALRKLYKGLGETMEGNKIIWFYRFEKLYHCLPLSSCVISSSNFVDVKNLFNRCTSKFEIIFLSCFHLYVFNVWFSNDWQISTYCLYTNNFATLNIIIFWFTSAIELMFFKCSLKLTSVLLKLIESMWKTWILCQKKYFQDKAKNFIDTKVKKIFISFHISALG